MRRLFLMILCCMVLVIPVSAISGITTAQSQMEIKSDGSCEAVLTIALQLDEPIPDLAFPLPEQAKDITVNGAYAKSSRGDGVRNVDLSGVVNGAGSYTLTIRYEMSELITESKKGALTLTLPLLSGFALPIEMLSFSVTLPEAPEAAPEFTSTYYQEIVESLMDITVSDNVISGIMDHRLQDRESLTMTLAVTEDMFPRTIANRWSMDTVDLLMILCGVLAALYWLAGLRCKRPAKIRWTTPSEGVTAGEVGCRLLGQGVDLTMMVISWAQLGYILIQMDDSGRVLLHKRMDMGNERSEFENRYFRKLFGKRKMAEATGYHYARLCRKAMHSVPGWKQTFARNSGNVRIFRGIAALIGGLSGVSFAIAYADTTAWEVFLSLLMGILGCVVAWNIQSAVKSLHGRDRLPLMVALGCFAVWLLLSLPAGEWNVALFVSLAQLIAGLFAFYGGRRTESGQQVAAELLGLRRYLRTVKREELKRLTSTNPHYFYDLAPYALAMGVDRPFARQFGSSRLPECTYLTTGMDGHMTAREWDQLLRETVQAMDALQKRMPLDRLLGR